jgi:hypothetical protein
VPRPEPGKGKEASACWKYFCCLRYEDGSEKVMCIIRGKDHKGEQKVCGAVMTKSRANTTSNYQRHLQQIKCSAHQAALIDVKKASARSNETKLKKQHAAIGYSSTTSKAAPAVATGAAAITHHLKAPRTPTASAADLKLYTKWVVLWSAIDMRPCSISSGLGFQGLIAHVAPAFAGRTIDNKTFDKVLAEEFGVVKEAVVAALQAQHEQLRGQPFCGMQLDLGSEQNRSFCTLSVLLMDSTFAVKRFTLVTREFPLQHTADDVAGWITDVSPIGM